MAVAKTQYFRDKILNWLKGTAFGTAPSTCYLALFTTAPTDAYTSGSPTGVEVSGGSYARQVITWSAVNVVAGTGDNIDNSAAITFPTATANWGTIVDAAAMDASTAGDMLIFGLLNASVTINTGNQMTFPITTGVVYQES